MKKILPLIILFIFSFSAIHAEKSWEIDGIKCNLSDDGTLTISGTGDMPYYVHQDDVPWFNDRSKINKVVIEYGVTSIGSHVFHLCLRLTSITIPNSVTSIGDYAFKNCNITSITIPNSVTSIGEKVFMDNLRLTSIIVEKDNPKYDSRDNCNAIIETKSNTLIAGCKNTVIPSSVTSIGDYAFFGSNLTSITIPNSVTSIGDYAFFDSDLTSITFKRTSPPEFGKEVFYIVNTSIPIYVPSISIDAYKEALKDYGFSNIQANPKQLFLTGNNFYLQDSQIDGADVSFTRDFTTNWEAIYLPFSLKYEDWKDDFEVARINGIHQYDDNDDGDIDRTVLEFVKMKNDDSVIEPNTPYLIKAKNSGKKTISVENTTLYEAKANQIECTTTTESFIFTGLYKKLSVWSIPQFANGKNYAMYEGNLSEEITTLSNIGPYRWYMTRENRNSAYGINNNNTAKEISIRVVGEETTGIANIQHTSPNTQTYDLNGRKVNENNLKPGMYVKNGRKFVVK